MGTEPVTTEGDQVVRLELDIPGAPEADQPDAQIAALVEENNALRDRVAFLERRIAELEWV